MNVKSVLVGEITEKVVVGHVGSTSEHYRQSGVPFFRTQNVGNREIVRRNIKYIDQKFHQKLKKSQLKAGDIIISRVISNRINCAIVPDEFDGANCANVIIIRSGKDVYSRYLLHYFSSDIIQRALLRRRVGSAQSVVNTQIVKSWGLSIPSLEEQKRIAAILDKADAIRKKRKLAIELTEQFLRSAFLDMFGDPITNPKAWPIAIMKDCITDISSGWSAKSDDKVKGPNDWAVLKISAVTSGRFLPSEHKVVSSIGSGRKLIVPKRGDLLFSRANTRELVAATCLVEEDSEKLFLPDKLWRLTVSNNMKPEYLRYLLAHPRYRSYLTRQATGTSGSMLNVSQQKLMGMKLPKPPIEVQQAFSDIVWKTYQLQTISNASAENMTAQFNGLTQRAFRGEL